MVAELIRITRAREYSRAYRMAWSVGILALSSPFPLRPTHRLVAGKITEERHRIGAQTKDVRVVPASTWDLSNSIAYKDAGDQPPVAGRYAVLLDGAGPKFASDVELMGTRTVLTSEKWYPALTAWFEQLERETGVKIVVACNPKSKFPQNPIEFGFRRVYYGCTEQLVKHSEFVITRMSAALSYAIMYHKPALCIYNDQMNSRRADFPEFFDHAEILGVTPINLDAPPSRTDEYLKVPEEAYGRYRANYLTSLRELKPNYRIIAEEILGLNGA